MRAKPEGTVLCTRIGIFGVFFTSSYPQLGPRGYSFGFNSYLLTTKSDLLLEEGVRGSVEQAFFVG